VLTLAAVLASTSLAGGGAVLAKASTARPAVTPAQPGCVNTAIRGVRGEPGYAEPPHPSSPEPAFTRGLTNTITWQPCPSSYWYTGSEVNGLSAPGGEKLGQSTGRQYILNITNTATGQRVSIYLPGGETESSYTVSGSGFPAAPGAIDGTKFEYRLSTRQRICTNGGALGLCQSFGYVYSEQSAPVSSTQDATAPALILLTLDNGLPYTNQLTVPVHLSAVDPSRPGGVSSGLGSMQFSLSPTFGCTVLSVCASSYAPNTTVALDPSSLLGLGGLLGGTPPPGDGLRTVYARVFDLANYMPPSQSLLRPIFGGQPQGNVSNVLSASILLDTTGPKLVVTAKSSTHVGKPVSFDATQSSDPSPGSGVDAGTAVWRFGDGSIASGLAVTHRYHKTGKYTVTFSMKDNAGNESTLKIHIKVKALNVPVTGSAVTTTGTPFHHQPLLSSPAVRITRLSLGKRRGRYVLTLKLSKAANVIVELRRLSPHPSITLKELKRHLHRGTSELVLGSLRRHSREQVIVAILGGAANVSTTRTVTVRQG
jgi:hypothetical protein